MGKDDTRGWNFSSLLWVVIAALLGGMAVKNNTAPTPSTPGAKANNSSQAAPRETADAWQFLSPLRTFLLPEVPADPRGTRTFWEQARNSLQKQVGALQFLVVLVADPVDTQSNYMFDQQVDTLHRVMGNEGYVLEGYYFPWRPDPASKLHRVEPGTLLYRNTGAGTLDNKTNLVLIFLVGETATGGVHKTAFRVAIEEIQSQQKALADAPEVQTDRSRIMVAGPVFSGAADSLARAIQHSKSVWGGDCPTFHVISGSAFAVDRERFKQVAGPDKISIHCTVPSIDVLKDALVEHVRALNHGKISIAWLSESATVFGDALNEHGNFAPEDREDRIDAKDDRRSVKSVEYRFPMNISVTRARVEELRRTSQVTSTLTLPASDANRLPISFDPSGSNSELPPLQTATISAPAVELMLTQMFASIRRHGVQCVGISATDVRDPIFLAELIRAQSPGVQILLVCSDLMHLHSDHRGVLQGALVASPYALYADDQKWSFPFTGQREEIVLSNYAYYGLYNAVGFLRGLQQGKYQFETVGKTEALRWRPQPPGTVRVAQPVSYGLPLRDLSDCDQLYQPPVWISMIGPNAIWPIACKEIHSTSSRNDNLQDYLLPIAITSDTWKKEYRDPPQPGFEARFAPSSGLVMWAWVAVGAAMLLGSLRWIWNKDQNQSASDDKPTSDDKAGLASASNPGDWAHPLDLDTEQCAPGKLYRVRYVFRLAMGLAVVAVIATNMWLCSIPLFSTASQDFRFERCFIGSLFLASSCVAAGLVGCAFFDFLRIVTPETPVVPKPGSLILTTAVLAAAMIVVTVFMAHTNHWYENPDWLLRFNAWSNFWNGVSPLMPLQLSIAAMLTLGYGFLWQAAVVGDERLILMPAKVPAFDSWDPTAIVSPPSQPAGNLGDVLRDELIFPIQSRYFRREGIVIVVSVCIAIGAWLGYLLYEAVNNQTNLWICDLSYWAFVVGSVLWCFRLVKTQQVCRTSEKALDKLFKGLNCDLTHAGEFWKKAIARIQRRRPLGLHSLWKSRPQMSRLTSARNEFEVTLRGIGSPELAAEKLYVVQADLYVRQACCHIIRLLEGLAVSGVFLLLAAVSLPYNTRALLEMNVTIMIFALGTLAIYYYVRFDRNELVSILVGGEPNQVDWNWSMMQSIVPIVLLVFFTVVSQAFPEIWRWLREMMDPVIRNAG